MARRIAAWLLALLLLPTAVQAEIFLAQPPAEWKAGDVLVWTIFDVNEGDAMLLSCGGENMLVDGGPGPAREDLRRALEARGLKNGLKYILNTHHHEDHITGIEHLFENGFTADIFLHPYDQKTLQTNKRLARTAKAAKASGARVRQVLGGDRFSVGGAEVELYRCTEISGVNAQSLVAKVTFGSASILLCADITGRTQRWFVENLPGDALKADLIKLPHHAITPAVPAFLDQVNPKAAVVTNRVRELDSKSLTQLQGRGWPVFFSGDGTVYAVTDGTDWYLYQTPGAF